MTTPDLIGKLLQAVVGLAAFGLVLAALLQFLDREDEDRQGFVATLKRGFAPRLVIVAGFVLVAVGARVLYGQVPWMTKALTNWLIVIGAVGALAVCAQLALEAALARASSTVRFAVYRFVAAAIVAALAVVVTLAASGAVGLLDWVTPALGVAAGIVGWPLVAVLVAAALLQFAPVRVRRPARFTAWALGAVSVVVGGLVAEGAGQTIGVWPWAFAAGFSIIGLLGYLADATPDSRPMLVFLAPAALLMTVGLVYPALRTTMLAFTNESGEFSGLENFVWMFTQPEAIRTLSNTVVWVVLAPLLSTAIGLAYAVFIDKSRGEKIYKMLVFMPMAISFVGAGIIWRFMYAYRGPEQEQIGLINALIVGFGGSPQQILQSVPINTLALIVVMIWIQTGFAMTVLSAALKGVPTEQIEAASLDGAGAWQRFSNVLLPGIRSSLVVVITTISIATLKVFDIVRTMTGGNFETSVVANEMYTQAFSAMHAGRGAALAFVLFLLVLPIVAYNIRVLNQQRAIR